ncbi:inhibin beta chain [Agrilus planipennis]|uniref:Inhibin beta chain n=1 Tax=Agrilus planipennis TaxID=224129 RepID=A0A1W4XJU5_AGRPL|nr:inhibin beta chain [Agrilus planipennis]
MALRPFTSVLLYLLVLFAIVVVGCDRIRHHHHTVPTPDHDDDDVYVSQLESSALDETSETSASVINCPNCFYKTGRNLKAESDNLRLEAIKRQILSKLGLQHKPNVTYSLPRDVILETISRAEDSWKFQEEDEEILSTSAKTTNNIETLDVDDFYGRTSEIISFGDGMTVNGNKYLEFRITPEPGQAIQELRVREATLWLKTELRKRPPTRCQQYLWAFRVKQFSFSNKLSLDEHNFGTKLEVNENNSGWQKLNLTDTVRRWLSEGTSQKLRLLIDCSCRCKNVHLHIPDTPSTSSSSTNSGTSSRRHDPTRPFLVIHTDPSTTRRVRRRAIDCSPESGNQCCKQRFYVSFKEIGWDDWVIAPQGYYANYCRGDCGHQRTPDQYLNYHTHVIEELRKSNHLSGMQPCCAPLKFSGMSLIYLGSDQNIIKRDLPKMVVDECGCP